jgi:hypothetical protein
MTAKLEGPLSGDAFLPMSVRDLGAAGYVQEEWFLSGTASSYALRGERTEDGRWEAGTAQRAAFKTRVLVIRPKDAGRFSGTVLVEWFNVSGGVDANPDWLFLHRHLMRVGAAWVGVSAQKAGIDGGGLVAGMPLKKANPARYGALEHPGDAFAYGIFTEAGRLLRTRGAGLLGPLEPRCVIAIGESQSAGFLVTYVNAIDPLEGCYDAFLIHGRAGGAANLAGGFLRAPRGGEPASTALLEPVGYRIREDVRVPVLTFQSETDVSALGGGRARQPDAERFRLWEVAGAAHFDTYGLLASRVDCEGVSIEELAQHLAPTDKPIGLQSREPINSGPQQHYVLNAAFAALERWARSGTPPPRAARLVSSDPTGTVLARDELGIARGGIRTPWVDAPSAVLSGAAAGGEGFTFLFGKTLALDADTLARLYPGGPDEHVHRFNAATALAVAEGFLLEADADEIRALARHGCQPSGWRTA